MNTRQISALFLLASLALSTAVHSQDNRRTSGSDSSNITYRITHPLHVVEASSNALVFRLTVDTAKREIENVSASVDVMTFDGGNSNRDSHAMEAIDALSYPDVRFTSTAIVRRHDTLSVTGTLSFHGVKKSVRMDAVSRWSGKEVFVAGTFALSLTDFGVERPSMLMLPVEDTLRFTFRSAFHWQ